MHKTCGSRFYNSVRNGDSHDPEAKPQQEAWGQSSPKARAVFVSADTNFSLRKRKISNKKVTVCTLATH